MPRVPRGGTTVTGPPPHEPVHPGTTLLQQYMLPLRLSQRRLAHLLAVPPRRINEIVHGHRAITPDTSLRLAKLFGVDEAHWLDLQTRYDIEIAKETTDLSQVQPLAVNHLVYRLQPSWRPRHQPDVYVPADLRTLTGPRQGSYDPPVNLYWQPGDINFATTGDVELFYSSALTSASTAEQLTEWINRDALVARWKHLSLPSRVRNAWETIHPALRDKDSHASDRHRIQDTILITIAEHGFALAGGSTLIGYDVVSRHTDDIEAFDDCWDTDAFNAAHTKVLDTCRENGWRADTVKSEDFDKQVLVGAGTGSPVVVQMVYYERSSDLERRTGGGLRLIFDDVVGGKGAAVADVASGRDLFDLANILATPGWSLGRVEDSMRAIKYGDQIENFRANIERFRRGDFDDDIRKSGFERAFCHRILDRD